MTLRVGESASTSIVMTPERVQAFADVTGDHNPVHLDAAYAAGTAFKRNIAHGIFTAAPLLTLLGMKLPGPGTVILALDVAFQSPAYVGDEVTCTVRVDEVVGHRVKMGLDARVGDRGVLTGTAKVTIPKQAATTPAPGGPSA